MRFAGLFVFCFFAATASGQVVDTIRGRNFSRGTTVPLARTYVECNFSFIQPRRISGKWVARVINLPVTATFRGCNMVNARPLAGSTLRKCNTWIIRRNVQGTSETLKFTDTDSTTYTIEVPRFYNRVLGRTHPGTLQVQYLPRPRVTQIEARGTPRLEKILELQHRVEDLNARLSQAHARLRILKVLWEGAP